MHTLTGYEITSEVRSGAGWCEYIGLRRTDDRRVLIKLVYTDMGVARIRREFEILEQVREARVVHALALEPCIEGVALVLERPVQLQSLASCFRQRGALGLDACLKLGIHLATALAEVHARGIVHNRLGLDTVLLRESDLHVVLTGFDTACRFPFRMIGLGSEESNFQTRSPEAHPHSYRMIDGRSDLYAVGCLLYKLLAGELPFAGLHGRALMHAHLVRAPIPLSQVRPGLMQGLVEIVHALLMKEPDARIRSAEELAQALRSCRTPGPKRASSLAHGGQKVVDPAGEHAVTRILTALHRCSLGSTQFVLVGGKGGAGKSKLTHAVTRTFASAGAVFVSQRCLPERRGQPFYLLGALLTQLMNKLRAADPEAAEFAQHRWREVCGRLGPLSPVPVESSQVVGSELPAGTALLQIVELARGLLVDVAKICMTIFCVDDLHEADHTSLAILADIRRSCVRERVCVVANYRSDLVGEQHPLRVHFATIPVLWVEMHSASVGAIERAAVVGRSTRGLDSLSRRCARLSPSMRLRLRLLAECQYNPPQPLKRRAILAVLHCQAHVLESTIRVAVDLGIATYCEFDGCQQKLYWQPNIRKWLVAGLSKKHRSELHIRIASEYYALTKQTPSAWISAALSLVQVGSKFFRRLDRVRATEALLRAGMMAMRVGAIEEGLVFLRRGMQMMPSELWTRDANLAKMLYSQVIESESRYGDARRAKACSERFLQTVSMPRHRLLAHRLRVRVEYRGGRSRAAYSAAVAACRSYGVELPTGRRSPATLRRAFRRLRRFEYAKSVVDTNGLESLSQALVPLIQEAAVAAFAINPWLGVEVSLVLRDLVWEHGAERRFAHFAGAAHLVASHILEGPSDHTYASASKIFEHLCSGVDDVTLATRWMLLRWLLAWRWSDERLGEEIEKLCLCALEQECVAFAELVGGWLGVQLAGGSLQVSAVREQAAAWAQRLGKSQLLKGVQWLCTQLDDVVHTDDGKATVAGQFRVPEIDRDSFSGVVEVARFACLAQLLVAHLGGVTPAKGLRKRVARLRPLTLPSRFDVDLVFLSALVQAHQLRRDPSVLRQCVGLWRNLRHLRAYSKLSPKVCLHRVQLVEAEIDRVRGKYGRAWARCMAAIDRAQANNQHTLAGIGYLTAERIVSARGFHTLRPSSLRFAGEAFSRSGVVVARDHVDDMMVSEQFAVGVEDPETFGTDDYTIKSDIRTVIELSREISRELRLEKLLRKLVRVLLSAVGGQRCVVVLALADELRVEAEAKPGEEPWTMLSIPLEDYQGLPATVVHLVTHTRQVVVSADASTDPGLSDNYLTSAGIRSLLCVPVLHQGSLLGVLYFEDRKHRGVFSSEHIQLLNQLVAQIASSIENARLFHDLDRVRDAALLAERAKTRFLLNLSHELRTPLNAVIGYSELIEEEIEDDDLESVEEDLANICAATERLQCTLRSIYELSRLESGRIAIASQPVDIRELVATIVAVYRPRVSQRGLTFDWECPKRLIVHSDADKLEYCLTSLVDNACRFTEHGQVSIVVTQVVEGGVPWVRIAIADTGIGIDAEQQLGLFDPFRQVDDSTTRSHEGAGVSLAVTKRFCERLQGRLVLQSALGEGSTFIVELPMTSL